MIFRLELSPSARADLNDVHDWVESQADSAVADAYLRRVIAKTATLADFPHRGTPRADLGIGSRSITFERRLLIVYRVEAETVTVLRVIGGMRDLARAFD